MRDRSRRFWSQAILVLANALSLALAERVITWLIISCLSVVMGWYFTVRHDRPLMTERSSRLFVLAAFVYLIHEYFYQAGIPVLALAHFMLLVCGCKFLERRALRDDAQVLILALLLLVVTSIVSGNVIYSLVLVLFMTIGVDALIRLHLASQRAHALRRNSLIRPGGGGERGRRARVDISLMGMIGSMGIVSVVIGAAIFVVVPRTSADMLSRLQSSATGVNMTGFADRLDLNRGGAIQSSNETVMRVQVRYDPPGYLDSVSREDLYFRGSVLDQYKLGPHSGHRGWGWVRRQEAAGETQQYDIKKIAPYDYGTSLIPGSESTSPGVMMVHKYWLEPGGDRYLFAPYPPWEMASENLSRAERTAGDLVLQCIWKPSSQVIYEVRSPVQITPDLVKLLRTHREQEHVPAPRVYLPDPPLPDAQRIRNLIRDEIGELPEPDDPEACQTFAEAIEGYLRSGRFTYTLENPRIAAGLEPVSEFLFRTRKGHCEYSASAMAIMCQLSGLPARVVSGYRGGEYNTVGGFYLIQKKHAHSWVEVFIPDRDWVRFDPTPLVESRLSVASAWWRQVQSYVDYLQFQWANLVVSYDTNMRSTLYESFTHWLRRPAHNEKTIWGAIWSFVRELFGWRLELSLSERVIYWVFTLLVLALAVLVSYVVIVIGWGVAQRIVRWAGTMEGGHDPRLEFYHHYRRLLENMGLSRRLSQTPAEFAHEIAEQYGPLGGAPLLVDAYYDVRYGHHELVGARRKRVDEFLDQLNALRRDDLVRSDGDT